MLLCSTFDDVLDVCPIGYYLEYVFWWTAGLHGWEWVWSELLRVM